MSRVSKRAGSKSAWRWNNKLPYGVKAVRNYAEHSQRKKKEPKE